MGGLADLQTWFKLHGTYIEEHVPGQDIISCSCLHFIFLWGRGQKAAIE